MYTIRDLIDDVRAKLFNFSREDFVRYGMHMPNYSIEADVRSWYHSPAVRAWRKDEAARGLALFDRYEAVRDRLKVHSFTRMVLEFLYERSTKSGLSAALQVA